MLVSGVTGSETVVWGGVGRSVGMSWAACGASDAARSRTKIMASEVIKSMSPLVVVWEIVEWEPELLGYMWNVFSVV